MSRFEDHTWSLVHFFHCWFPWRFRRNYPFPKLGKEEVWFSRALLQVFCFGFVFQNQNIFQIWTQLLESGDNVHQWEGLW